jgi:hypothetical protein
MVITIFGGSGCVSHSHSMVAGAERLADRSVPMPTLVAPGSELAAAESYALRDPHCFALMGAGRSMEPLYASGTAIVVREQSFLMLRTGQIVVYRNARGRFVAHLLVQESAGGWSVMGLNNTEPDDEQVTANNYVGVVLAAYASAKMPSAAELATRQAIKVSAAGGARTASLQ